ncbi:MAG: hypothetical protein AABX53_02940 [Nanoarchaeota archaeon]
MKTLCTLCGYRFETPTIKDVCPYCGERRTLSEIENAENLVNEL